VKPKDIFGIGVRLLGLVFLGRGLFLVPAAADDLFSALVRLDPARILSALWLAGWPFLAAFWLVCGAPPLIRIAYPDTKANDESPVISTEKKEAK